MSNHRLLEVIAYEGLTNLGIKLGISPQAVFDWKKKACAGRDFKLPVEHVKKLCEISGFNPADFRPDLFEVHWRYKKDASSILKRKKF